MFNYKRLAFIFFLTTFFLLSTETQMESAARRGLLSLFNIVVDESSQVSQTAPSSFLDTLENTRISFYDFLNKETSNLNQKIILSKGFLSVLLSVAYYLVLFLKFIASFVITFYPFVIFLLYMFFSSRFFKKDEFGYNDF